ASAAPAAPAAVALEGLERAERLRDEYRRLASRAESLRGDELAVVAVQRQAIIRDYMDALGKLVPEVLRLEEEGAATKDLVERTRGEVEKLSRRIPDFLDSVEEKEAELRSLLGEGSEPTASDVEDRIRVLEDTLDDTIAFNLRHLEHLDQLDLPSDAARSELELRLERRAFSLGGRLALARKRMDENRAALDASPGDGALVQKLRVATDARDRAAASLRRAAKLMDSAGLESAGYRQLLIESTGQITGDVLDRDVARGLLDNALDAARSWLDQNLAVLMGKLGLFTLIMGLFWMIGALTRRFVSHLLSGSRSSVTELARRIIVGTAGRIVTAIGFFFALSQIGVNVTALLAGLGIAGFIVGFALQDTLGNFASGTMILVYRPFDVGDIIEAAGVSGSVHTMNLVSTTILTLDNQTLVVPNSRIWGDVIRNVTAQTMRRVDLSYPLALDADVGRACALFAEILESHPDVRDDPKPTIEVHRITDSAAELIVRPWVDTANYWPVYWALNRAVMERLHGEGIELGAPRRDVHLRNAAEPR
ncbi:MAG: mechanosensitive ion channel domain-containing protein, partial [Myxococcota bacterium]